MTKDKVKFFYGTFYQGRYQKTLLLRKEPIETFLRKNKDRQQQNRFDVKKVPIQRRKSQEYIAFERPFFNKTDILISSGDLARLLNEVFGGTKLCKWGMTACATHSLIPATICSRVVEGEYIVRVDIPSKKSDQLTMIPLI